MLPLLVATALVACSGTRDVREPGEKLGTFIVNGKLVATTCGKADPTFRYEVRLSREGDKLYWAQGSTPVVGSIDGALVRMEVETSALVSPKDERSGSPGCTMVRRDTLAAELEGEPVQRFSGAIVYAFDVAQGDCAGELAAVGGAYATLPCTMTYEIDAAQRVR
jgi:hypothetical protein